MHLKDPYAERVSRDLGQVCLRYASMNFLGNLAEEICNHIRSKIYELASLASVDAEREIAGLVEGAGSFNHAYNSRRDAEVRASFAAHVSKWLLVASVFLMNQVIVIL